MQLALNISLQEEATLESFCWTGNEVLYKQLVASLLNQETVDKRFFIHGSQSSGKSHILQGLISAFEQNHKTALYLPLKQICQNTTPAILENIEQANLVCLDDIDEIAGNKEWEEAIFYIYNRLKEANNALVISANSPIRGLNIQMPDLQSRLSWEFVFHLNQLSDTDKITILQKKAKARGLVLSKNVANFMINRLSRNMGDLVELLNKLDRASLEAKRKLTIPFIKATLL